MNPRKPMTTAKRPNKSMLDTSTAHLPTVGNTRGRKLSRITRQIISGFVSVSLITAPLISARAEVSNNAQISRSDYEACQTQNEQQFRTTIERITVEALRNGLEHVDYQASVNAKWRDIGMDQIVDERVDAAVEEVRKGTSWGTLIQSLAYQEEAKKLAIEVADRVYRSKAVIRAIEDLAVGVGKDVGKQIEFATVDAATPAIKCLRAFLGPRYGETVARAVATDAQNDFAMSKDQGGADVTPGAVLRESSGGLTGVAILLVRRQLANLARSVGQRLVGSILARLVSVVAGGVGIVLIAKDLWDLRHGVLPIIATEMKSAETKKKVREELAKGLKDQIAGHIRQIGTQSADRIITIWHQFRSAHAKTLELAQQNDDFKNFVNATNSNQLGRLDEVTSLVLEREGESGIAKRLNDGTLQQSVSQLPDAAMTIARETRSLEEAIQWNALAQDDIVRITDYGIYRTANPASFTRNSLTQVLNLHDRVAVTRMASLRPETRETLLALDNAPELKKLAQGLTEHELETFAGYLNGLAPGPRTTLLEAVAKTPGKMQILASTRVRKAVLSSADQEAAVDMMLRADNTFDAMATLHNFKLAWTGKVSPMLIVDKHPIALTSLLFALLLVLLMLRRIFSTRAPKPEPKPGI